MLVGFTIQHTADLSPENIEVLQTLGFVLPSPEQLKRGSDEGHDNKTSATLARPDFKGVPRPDPTLTPPLCVQADDSTPEEGTTVQSSELAQANAIPEATTRTHEEGTTSQASGSVQVIEVPSSDGNDEEVESGRGFRCRNQPVSRPCHPPQTHQGMERADRRVWLVLPSP